jgi:hypothetical protein
MEIIQKTRVSQLRFVVYNRPLHPELFDIHHDHRIVKSRYEARLWVTSVGHAIGFFVGNSAITQLIVPEETDLPLRGRLISVPFRGEKNRQVNSVASVKYLTSFQIERMSARVFKRTYNELAESLSKTGIFVPFPLEGGNGMCPFIYLDCQARARHLHVFAYHAFPEEQALIRAQSLFEVE